LATGWQRITNLLQMDHREIPHGMRQAGVWKDWIWHENWQYLWNGAR